MPTLYLTEQGAYLRKDGGRLCVEKDGAKLLDVPLEDVEGVCIFGNIQLSTQVMTELLDREIEVAFFTMNGKLRGQLTPALAKNSLLRLKQYEKSKDNTAALQFSRWLVRAKIKNSTRLLKRHTKAHPEESFAIELKDLNTFAEQCLMAASMAELLGREGAAAKIYWSCFARMLRNGMTFPGRKYHPCTDPMNALLSFGYTLLGSEIQSLLDGIGFDPYIGFYHQPDYGRASLAQDLLEEYRAPAVDRLTLYLLNNRIFEAKNFETRNKGDVRLTREGLKRYFIEYEQHMNRTFQDPDYKGAQSFRTIFRLQAYKLSKWITSDEPYEPYSFDT